MIIPKKTRTVLIESGSAYWSNLVPLFWEAFAGKQAAAFPLFVEFQGSRRYK